MTKVGGKRRKLLLDVDPVAIPADKCADGEAMPEIVQPWPAMVAWAPQADLTGQACAFRGIVSSSQPRAPASADISSGLGQPRRLTRKPNAYPEIGKRSSATLLILA